MFLKWNTSTVTKYHSCRQTVINFFNLQNMEWQVNLLLVTT